MRNPCTVAQRCGEPAWINAPERLRQSQLPRPIAPETKRAFAGYIIANTLLIFALGVVGVFLIVAFGGK